MGTILWSQEGKREEWLREVRGLLESRRPCPFILLEATLSAPTVATYLAGWAASSQRLVLYIDAANAFDPYLVSLLAQRRGRDPLELLQRILISRPFTCYQLQTLLQDRVEAVIEEKGAGLVILSGIVDLLLDPAVRDWEAKRIMGKVLEAIGRVRIERGIPLLATQRVGGDRRRRTSLLLWAEREAQVVGRLEELARLPRQAGQKERKAGVLRGSWRWSTRL